MTIDVSIELFITTMAIMLITVILVNTSLYFAEIKLDYNSLTNRQSFISTFTHDVHTCTGASISDDGYTLTLYLPNVNFVEYSIRKTILSRNGVRMFRVKDSSMFAIEESGVVADILTMKDYNISLKVISPCWSEDE